MRHLLGLLLIISAVFSFTLMADDYTLPNGKVLEDPYIISQRPDGLEIGHKKGIIFVRFTDLPEQVRKKYNYDPAKVAEFEKQKEEYKEKLRVEKEAKDAEEAAARAENQKIMLNWQVSQLDIEIQKTETRINFLKVEITRLDKEYEGCLNKSAELAGKAVTPNSGGNNYSYGWNGGFITSGGGSGAAEATRSRTVSKLGDDASSAKSKADSFRKELETKQYELIDMKNNYETLKAQQKAEKQ
ncbi:MAG: hypothetical protein WCP55_15500 [Lentisphaerota bacterium]